MNYANIVQFFKTVLTIEQYKDYGLQIDGHGNVKTLITNIFIGTFNFHGSVLITQILFSSLKLFTQMNSTKTAESK